MYVYPTEFESRGILADAVSSYSIFGLFVFQIVMFGFFSTIFGKELTWASMILLLGEVIYILIFKFVNISDMKFMYDEFEEDEDNTLRIDEEKNQKTEPLMGIKKHFRRFTKLIQLNTSKISEKHR